MKKIETTPQTYIDMNKEFIEQDIPFRITVPTQEAIDKWQSQSPPPYETPSALDIVQEMRDKIGGRPND